MTTRPAFDRIAVVVHPTPRSVETDGLRASERGNGFKVALRDARAGS